MVTCFTFSSPLLGTSQSKFPSLRRQFTNNRCPRSKVRWFFHFEFPNFAERILSSEWLFHTTRELALCTAVLSFTFSIPHFLQIARRGPFFTGVAILLRQRILATGGDLFFSSISPQLRAEFFLGAAKYYEQHVSSTKTIAVHGSVPLFPLTPFINRRANSIPWSSDLLQPSISGAANSSDGWDNPRFCAPSSPPLTQ